MRFLVHYHLHSPPLCVCACMYACALVCACVWYVCTGQSKLSSIISPPFLRGRVTHQAWSSLLQLVWLASRLLEPSWPFSTMLWLLTPITMSGFTWVLEIWFLLLSPPSPPSLMALGWWYSVGKLWHLCEVEPFFESGLVTGSSLEVL